MLLRFRIHPQIIGMLIIFNEPELPETEVMRILSERFLILQAFYPTRRKFHVLFCRDRKLGHQLIRVCALLAESEKS